MIVKENLEKEKYSFIDFRKCSNLEKEQVIKKKYIVEVFLMYIN